MRAQERSISPKKKPPALLGGFYVETHSVMFKFHQQRGWRLVSWWAEWRINPRRGEGAREGEEEEEEGEKVEEIEEEEEEEKVKGRRWGRGVGGGGGDGAVWRHTTHRGRWQQDVCEVSLLPRRWQERGKPDAALSDILAHLSRSTTDQPLDSLESRRWHCVATRRRLSPLPPPSPPPPPPPPPPQPRWMVTVRTARRWRFDVRSGSSGAMSIRRGRDKFLRSGGGEKGRVSANERKSEHPRGSPLENQKDREKRREWRYARARRRQREAEGKRARMHSRWCGRLYVFVFRAFVRA
ncbi:hypothetical protein DBV15_07462 [Temnothorax longispinosus]|uniref:Uncharacterized protein n=1 Tax=Temnothorax longispinosus TaxID=300112 RepID=A0A4S2KPU5_9HYME|nr:hypothetical protein DBV15_07462 [Temnothorax longispinosus]